MIQRFRGTELFGGLIEGERVSLLPFPIHYNLDGFVHRVVNHGPYRAVLGYRLENIVGCVRIDQTIDLLEHIMGGSKTPAFGSGLFDR